MKRLVKVGQRVLDLDEVAEAHWENDKLFVYLKGGRFLSLRSAEANAVWKTLQAGCLDLMTGEVMT